MQRPSVLRRPCWNHIKYKLNAIMYYLKNHSKGTDYVNPYNALMLNSDLWDMVLNPFGR